jgi:ferredoxin-NADP reductase
MAELQSIPVLENTSSGLSQTEAHARLSQYGYNELPEHKTNLFLKLLSYFWGPISWMIEVAAILSAVVRHWDDFVIILVLLVMNAGVGFWEEFQAGNAIAALKAKLALHARVRRDGVWTTIPARELVPGDVTRVSLGEIVPADAKLLGGDSIEVDQSALTGESLPVERNTGEDIYSGSIIRQGEANAVVTATGQKTYLAPAVLIAALLHIFMVNGFTARLPMKALWIIYALGFLGITVYHRIYMPLRIWRRPWVVVRDVPELGDARTLVLKPVGHNGLVFEPGQFAWLKVGKTSFHSEEHPISFSSSAENPSQGEVSFTIKALGDWSSNIASKTQSGTRFWLDGPYGVFSPDREQGPGYVLIGGGIGITPLYSMCLTQADRGDVRPVLLFYGGRDLEELTFHSELDQLTRRMNLKCIYVLKRASAAWQGETGYIDANLLRRYLPQQYKRFQYFVCGPLSMMDGLERELPAMGITPENIHTERFGEV